MKYDEKKSLHYQCRIESLRLQLDICPLTAVFVDLLWQRLASANTPGHLLQSMHSYRMMTDV